MIEIMEFRRSEVVRVLREVKKLDNELTRKLFEKLSEQALPFTIRAKTFGPYTGCLVISVTDRTVSIRATTPKARVTVDFSEIEIVEVDSNMEVLHHDEGENCRWENINV